MLRFISPPLILLDIGRIGMKLHVVVAQQLLTLFFPPYLDMDRGHCDKFISDKLSFGVERFLASTIN